MTFLFTDIEGSTALLARLGDGYARLLDDVRGIARRAVRRAGGREVDARADEYFAVFHRAGAALQAAVTIQRTMGTRRWPSDVECRVRAGVHTGEAALTDAGYIGLPVHVAARVCFAANGGQVVISEEAMRAAEASMPDGVVLRELGRHRLAGAGSHVLYQVEADGLLCDFPALRTGPSARRSGAGTNGSSGANGDQRAFARIASRLESEPGVARGTGFGASQGLRVDGRIFAIFASDGLVVKLPKSRVDELVEAGIATRFDPRRNGRAMKEWAVIPSAQRRRWGRLADEALRIVRADASPS